MGHGEGLVSRVLGLSLALLFFGVSSLATAQIDCNRILSKAAIASPVETPDRMHVFLESDSAAAERNFLDRLVELSSQRDPRLKSALVTDDDFAIRAAFDFSRFETAIAVELMGLSKGMNFSLFRHLYESRAFAEQEAAILKYWSHPDVLYFSPGHGSPGAVQTIVASLKHHEPTVEGEGENSASIRLHLPIRTIWREVSHTSAALRATVVFYASCNAGLSATTERGYFASAAEGFAREIKLPVVAPLGALIHLVTVPEPTLVYVSVSGPKGVLHEDQAFGLFLPDGTSRALTFKEAMKMIARPGVTNQYVNNWNPVTPAN